jgi:hypothetical protein
MSSKGDRPFVLPPGGISEKHLNIGEGKNKPQRIERIGVK